LLTYKFEPGIYVIVARKTGYLPTMESTLNVDERELRGRLKEKSGGDQRGYRQFDFSEKLQKRKG